MRDSGMTILLPAPEAIAATSAANLRRLVALRVIAIAGQALAVWFAASRLHLALPLEPLSATLTILTAANLLTWLRLRRNWPVHDAELFAHLAFDVLGLTVLLYYTGGSTNPFATLYLLPLTLTAAALPWAYTWAMAGLTLACYSLLLAYYVPLPQIHTAHGDDFHLHVLGMWLGFILSAGLISYFAVRMTQTLRERDRLRSRMESKLREQQLRHERVLALGTFAAGAAHELATPLSTIAVLGKELERDMNQPSPKLILLREQIGRCKDMLASLTAAAGHARAEGGGPQALEAYLGALIARWRELRPSVKVTCRLDGARPGPRIVADQTLSQALLNVLNNAADASPGQVEVDGGWNAAELWLDILDRGPGIAPEAQEHAGEPFFSTKESGMGLGLFLARGTFDRLGGSVTLENRDGGGAVCRLRLPLLSLRVPSDG